jgi:hypothetical protein
MSLDQALAIVKAAGFRIAKPKQPKVTRPALNAVGKPYPSVRPAIQDQAQGPHRALEVAVQRQHALRRGPCAETPAAAVRARKRAKTTARAGKCPRLVA